MDPTFTIRPCKDVDEASYYFLKWPVQEGWNHSTDDAEIRHAFYPCDPDGFMLATITNKDDGQETVVGMVLALKHTKDLAWIGCFIVAEQYRGAGYGRRIFQHAMDYLEGTRYIGLDAKLEKVKSYERVGFELTGGWTGKTYRGDIVRDVLNKLKGDNYTDVNILDWQDDGGDDHQALEQLALLDQQHSGYYRPEFWTHWMRLHTTAVAGYKARDYGRYAVKVLNADGGVAHFATIRPAVKGFVITLISGDLHVAEALLRHMAQWIIDSASDSSTWLLPKDHRMVINGNGCATNQACMDLYQGLGFEWVSTRERMFFKGVHPSTDPSGLYSIASLTVG
ncbi:hypothetical protein BCR42DRAFT_3992 [Absidia repens]|uniref:N-acetyltransferase domain-containing protein n=1 Tax=Absidia repens TaxID=90262 RepID=A0A1X2J054_9FUNG|nr:hypothetical protein BCR42DRAFT_3992 [Absidia repens]